MMNQNRLQATADYTWTSYLYDALGRRVSKAETPYYDYDYSPSTTYGPEGRTYWVYDGWNLAAEYSGDYHASGTPPPVTLLKTWLWGCDLSGSLQGAGGVGGLLATSLEYEYLGIYCPLYDGNGNVHQYLDNSGSVVARYEYDGFGAYPVFAGTHAWQFPFIFSTKYLDTNNSWTSYYGYRDYDPFTGRWLSRDPIGERGGVNLYGFVGNEPLWHIDVLGLKTTKACPFDVQGGHSAIGDRREDRDNDGKPDDPQFKQECDSGRYYGASCFRTGVGSGFAWPTPESKKSSMDGTLYNGPLDKDGKPTESYYNKKAQKEDPTIGELLQQKIQKAEADAVKECKDESKCCSKIILKVNCQHSTEMDVSRKYDPLATRACNYSNEYSCGGKDGDRAGWKSPTFK